MVGGDIYYRFLVEPFGFSVEWRFWGIEFSTFSLRPMTETRCFLFYFFSEYLLEIHRRSFLPRSEWQGLGVFLVWVLFSTPIWNDTSYPSSWGAIATWGSRVFNVVHLNYEVSTVDSSSLLSVALSEWHLGIVFFSFKFAISREFWIDGLGNSWVADFS